MILGKITGKTTTNDFKFIAEKETRKFEYVQVYHEVYEYVLCQIVEIEKEESTTIAYCQAIGYYEKGRVKKPRIPFSPGIEVLDAEDEFIRKIVSLEESNNSAFIGNLDGKNISVSLDLNKVLTMHLAVLAKSGSGKSYAVGVLLEEIAKRKIPVVIIDPHGEYTTLKYKNDNEEEKEKLAKLGLQPEAYNISEYGDTSVNPGAKPLKLSNKMDQQELIQLIPGKLSNSQLAVLYSSIKKTKTDNFDSLILSLEEEENNVKYSVISMVEYIRNLGVFSEHYTPHHEIVKPGTCTVLNLKGIQPDMQEIIVYKLCKDLFEERKKDKLPPFFLVVEEAHNYCPERSFGETKASKTFRNIASEGRKFGLGLCIVSQRPARVDKSVLSQCTTQIILKVTNPNDLKAVSASIEGLTGPAEKEIQNLPIGTAMVTGITDVPLLVNIRPRKTLHGGKAQSVLEEKKDFMEQSRDFTDEEILPIIKPRITEKDIRLMSEKPVRSIKRILVPCRLLTCAETGKEYKLLMEMTKGRIVEDNEIFKTRIVPDTENLTKTQVNILRRAFKNKEFTEAELSEETKKVSPEEDIDALVSQGYLKKEGSKYKLSEDHIFTKLSKLEIHDKITYEQVQYDEKLEEEVSLDEAINNISRYAKVKDNAECYLLIYRAEH